MNRYADRLEDVHLIRVDIDIEAIEVDIRQVCDGCGGRKPLAVRILRRLHYCHDPCDDQDHRTWVQWTEMCSDCDLSLSYGRLSDRRNIQTDHHRLLAQQRAALQEMCHDQK
jgi:hypothetical protein